MSAVNLSLFGVALLAFGTGWVHGWVICFSRQLMERISTG